MAEKVIHFEVTSREGHSEYDLVPKEALTKIQELSNEGKWLYIGGKPHNVDMITEDELINAYDNEEEIMMVNGLGGGEQQVHMELTVDKNQVDDVVVNLSEPYPSITKVDVSLAKGNLVSTLANRDVIVRALERKLEEKAVQEANAMKQLLNV